MNCFVFKIGIRIKDLFDNEPCQFLTDKPCISRLHISCTYLQRKKNIYSMIILWKYLENKVQYKKYVWGCYIWLSVIHNRNLNLILIFNVNELYSLLVNMYCQYALLARVAYIYMANRVKSQHLFYRNELCICKSALIDWWEIARDLVIKYSAFSNYKPDKLMTLITYVSG